jgi:hypothetical protein
MLMRASYHGADRRTIGAMRSRALGLISAIPFLLPVLLAPSGCHRTIDSICRQKCECEPCTDADMETCIADTEAAVAEVKGCEEQLDAYLACYDETLSCQSGVGTSTCDAEESALEKCSGTGNPFVSVCEQAFAKVAKCIGAKPQEETECTGVTRCFSLCTLDTSCDVIQGFVFSESFQACVNGCNGVDGTGGIGGGF